MFKFLLDELASDVHWTNPFVTASVKDTFAHKRFFRKRFYLY